MLIDTDSSAPSFGHAARVRAYLAALAVSGLVGTVVVAPLASAHPLPIDATFHERIHQQYVPVDAGPIDIPLAPSPAEELPPEPTSPPEASAEQAGAAETGMPPLYTGGGSPAEWMAAAGIAESDWGYVDYVVSRESSWNPNAMNSGSGACGLVQALPCSKVPGNGLDPVDNLRWANGYAVGRYGSWAGAYDFWINNHWW